jgi:2-C-methyl-D-erythritol 4-phosphate cytidylyltransferase
MTISAIVPAAGCGARAALNGNKILAPLLGKPILSWTLAALSAQHQWNWTIGFFEGHESSVSKSWSETRDAQLVEIVIAAQHGEFAAIEGAVEAANLTVPHRVVEGGTSRQDSVFRAVEAATGDFVLVHDAARPCLDAQTLRKVIIEAQSCGAAIVALPVTDTVKIATSSEAGSIFPTIESTLDRGRIWLAQTPQVFRRDWFLAALESAQRENFVGTDCASLMERAGHQIALVAGDSNNLKVTYAADLERATSILKDKP